eukprot:179975-Prymnesium_polylepis.1
MGLSIFAEQFQAHQISGDVLPLLTLQELKDMGINFVGPRTHLLKHINKVCCSCRNARLPLARSRQGASRSRPRPSRPRQLKRQFRNLQRNK